MYMFSRLHICMHALHIYIYSDIYPFAQPKLHIYIYMQHKPLNHCAQPTGAAGNCSQHGIMIQKSPPESIIGFY